jgi:phosphatidylglycerophosphate synthase
MLNPANKITLFRILAIPVLVALLHFPSKIINALAGIWFPILESFWTLWQTNC